MTGTIARGIFEQSAISGQGKIPPTPLYERGRNTVYKPKTWVSQARLYLQA